MGKISIINKNLDEASKEFLSGFGFTPFSLQEAKYLDFPLSSHPDMLMFMGFDTLFCHEKYYRENTERIDRILKLTKYSLCVTDEYTDNTYPHDVLFNAALVGKYLICNTRHVSEKILEAAGFAGKEIIHVPQGYTKCSVCKISENALITSDVSVYKAVLQRGIEALLISAGSIELEGFEYGFIGGTSGQYGDKVFFCGDISLHPDYASIKSFCEKHGKATVSLSKKPLRDTGSIFFID